jgi:hypothetical protein
MSKQRKLRNKLSFDEDEAADAVPGPPSTSTSHKKESTKPKTAALLSFGDDEESVVTKPKFKKDKSTVSKFHRGNVTPAAVAPSQRQSAGKQIAVPGHSSGTLLP